MNYAVYFKGVWRSKTRSDTNYTINYTRVYWSKSRSYTNYTGAFGLKKVWHKLHRAED